MIEVSGVSVQVSATMFQVTVFSIQWLRLRHFLIQQSMRGSRQQETRGLTREP